MGKRGPQPKGEFGRKIARTAVLSTRLQPDTRARLTRAAMARGRSLSQELEYRLRASFAEEDKIVERCGSQANGAILELLGAVIQSTCTSWSVKTADGWVPDVARDPGEWLCDPKLFEHVLTAIVHALMWFKPEGGRDHFFYSSKTEELINEIRSADPSLPITKRSTRQHAMAILQSKLGDLARRPHPHDEWSTKEIRVFLAPLGVQAMQNANERTS
jgi:DNA-binding TFAR19-related protein (PDSD5 family)